MNHLQAESCIYNKGFPFMFFLFVLYFHDNINHFSPLLGMFSKSLIELLLMLIS